MTNTGPVWQTAVHTNNHLLAAQQEPYEKACLLAKMFRDFLEIKSGEWAVSRKTTKTERARGLGRKTREEIGKGNQMTTLRFQRTGEGHQTSPASASRELSC